MPGRIFVTYDDEILNRILLKIDLVAYQEINIHDS